MLRYNLNPPPSNELSISSQNPRSISLPLGSGHVGEIESKEVGGKRKSNKYAYAMKEAQKPFMGMIQNAFMMYMSGEESALFQLPCYRCHLRFFSPPKPFSFRLCLLLSTRDSHHDMVDDDDWHGHLQPPQSDSTNQPNFQEVRGEGWRGLDHSETHFYSLKFGVLGRCALQMQGHGIAADHCRGLDRLSCG